MQGAKIRRIALSEAKTKLGKAKEELRKNVPAMVHAAACKFPPIDNINRPNHYTSHPSGIECIDVVEHMGFNLGNAMKYIWRADEKGSAIEDLKKAKWYIERELQKRSA